MKRYVLYLALVAVFVGTLGVKAFAASETKNLPTRWTYTYEWINLNVFTWQSESKVILLDSYAQKRVADIAIAYSAGKTDQANELLSRYQNIQQRMNQIIEQKGISDKVGLVNKIKDSMIVQQKSLSQTRQTLQADEQKQSIASEQETSANQTRIEIVQNIDKKTADAFSDKIVSVWRDPTGNESQATRVYAAGTSESTNTNNGVIIDGGEAKISQDNSGSLKIEYAPGTGPSSVTADNGQKIWKIVQSDGSVIDSYTAGSWVVIGQAGGVAGNVVVNTVSGGTSTGGAQTVVGSGGGSAGQVVVGGKAGQVTQVGQESSGATDSGQTVVNGSNSLNSTNQLNTVSGSAGGASQVEQVAPAQQGL